ncbi:hypothetical protein [Methylocapsa acidiphila]|uniref:hypothetical protein n=1 Tax=Methylocapsa acidiphila TaxID=133552 RepID=UPI0012EBC335|nr:hypothetical protein [Methylocapsa acidiphila]
MASFQISDPSTKLILTDAMESGRPVSKGTVTFVVENLTGMNRTASLQVQPQDPMEIALYQIAGSAPTNPSIRSVDFGPREVQNVEVTITATRGSAAKSASFRLRAALEDDPDNDAIDSRPIAFDIPAAPPSPPPAKAPFPWWAVGVAVALVAVIGGGAWYALRGHSTPTPPPHPNPPQIAGTWINLDPNTRSIPQLTVANNQLHVWGACHPTNCDWGVTNLNSGPTAGVYTASYNQGFSIKNVTLSLNAAGQLTVTTATHFTDNSGRPDYSSSDRFRAQ